MPTLQEKIDKRANVWEQMKAIMERREDGLSAEDLTTYNRAEKDYDRLDGEISAEERHAQREAANSTVTKPDVKIRPETVENAAEQVAYDQAFTQFVKAGMLDMTAEDRATLREGFRNFDAKEIRNAGGVGTGSAGGYLVPEGFREVIIEKMKAFGNVEGVATVIDTSTGNPLPWATNDDTGNVGALLAENTAATQQDFSFGTAQLGAYKYTSKLVLESIEFLQDVAWTDLEAFLGRKLAERLARIHNQHFTTGTGTSQPQGLVTGVQLINTVASATAIAADELIDLQHAVDPAYRNERSQYMLTDTALKGIRKLKATGTGDYLFQPAYTAGMPTLIAGRPYVINQDMAVPAANAISVLYGDYQEAYVVRRVMNIDLLRLAERYAEFGQVGFIAFDRYDGLVQDANAYAAIKQAAS